jgi:putative transcriptional regulator
MPTHTHDGSELTLVLAGGFSDESGHFVRGDVAEADPSINHQPVADPGEDCLCLAVTDAPIRLTGPFGRLLNPFLRI